MMNQEQFDLLKQGIGKWNSWRREHPDIQPVLSEVDFRGADLRGADLHNANLGGVDLRNASLSNADLSSANLSNADLSSANLSRANLYRVNLRHAKLGPIGLKGVELSWADSDRSDFAVTYLKAFSCGADLQSANLRGADLHDANLNGANLNLCDLRDANLSDASLRRANLSNALAMRTVFTNIDLSQTRGLDTMEHQGPSEISISTIYRSQGKIPEAFLRGAGVDDTFIEYIYALIKRPFEYFTCFISYSSKNQDFAERLHADLQNKGVRCWFAPHDMRTGDKIRERIDETIRLYDKLLLILSERAVASSWVETEVETALEKERQMQERGNPRTVLFPIRLDNTVLHTTKPWAKEVRRRHITDFTGWKQHDSYRQALEHLLRDLKAVHNPKD
jgi:uncharacterized protein YjbI with pentapeptide repeats